MLSFPTVGRLTALFSDGVGGRLGIEPSCNFSMPLAILVVDLLVDAVRGRLLRLPMLNPLELVMGLFSSFRAGAEGARKGVEEAFEACSGSCSDRIPWSAGRDLVFLRLSDLPRLWKRRGVSRSLLDKLPTRAGASRTELLERVRLESSFVGEYARLLVSCSTRSESRMADAAGSISHISAMILRAFSSVRIAIVEVGGMCGSMVSMYSP